MYPLFRIFKLPPLPDALPLTPSDNLDESPETDRPEAETDEDKEDERDREVLSRGGHGSGDGDGMDVAVSAGVSCCS
jgi:hypothetical protein